MHLIVYTSQSEIPKGKLNQELTFIEAIAKVNNPKHGITGILLYFQGNFMQVIEGDESELKSLMKNIEKDKRHSNVQYLADQKTEKQGFGAWNMDFFNLEGGKKIDFESLKKLTESFQHLPPSDTLTFYYKNLLGLTEEHRDK